MMFLYSEKVRVFKIFLR